MPIADLLKAAAQSLEQHSDTARLDAELLLAHCLNKNRAHLYTWPEKVPDEEQQVVFTNLVKQRLAGMPIAYLTGEREFWSMSFRVTKDTLVPRPETELVVQLALDHLHECEGPVLDLGTGCGAIAISIASEFTNLLVDAVDQSPNALNIARSNAKSNSVKVRFFASDWFANVTRKDYRIIISNPPYIAPDDPHLQRGGLQFEPIAALRAANDGMADIENIVANAPFFLAKNGWLMIEHGQAQGEASRLLMQAANFHNIRTERDLENRERVTLGQHAGIL